MQLLQPTPIAFFVKNSVIINVQVETDKRSAVQCSIVRVCGGGIVAVTDITATVHSSIIIMTSAVIS
jgi:hypothetical protein